jgi:hypothetical protein
MLERPLPRIYTTVSHCEISKSFVVEFNTAQPFLVDYLRTRQPKCQLLLRAFAEIIPRNVKC